MSSHTTQGGVPSRHGRRSSPVLGRVPLPYFFAPARGAANTQGPVPKAPRTARSQGIARFHTQKYGGVLVEKTAKSLCRDSPVTRVAARGMGTAPWMFEVE